ncbi:uncharacterized protein V1518DRAFT_409297 [Limtongia smithiae]|uniref:uncharacterized protein n=1 Tax=Limtongia smithiae TaxID=1125753 RepID=UPI0034CEA065
MDLPASDGDSQRPTQGPIRSASSAALKRVNSKHFVVSNTSRAHLRNSSTRLNVNKLKLTPFNAPSVTQEQPVPTVITPSPVQASATDFIPSHAALAGQYGVLNQQRQADIKRSKSSDALTHHREGSSLALAGRKGSRANLAQRRTAGLNMLTAAAAQKKKNEKKRAAKQANNVAEEDETETEDDEDDGLSMHVAPRQPTGSSIATVDQERQVSQALMTDADQEINMQQQRTSSSSAPTSATASLLSSPVTQESAINLAPSAQTTKPDLEQVQLMTKSQPFVNESGATPVLQRDEVTVPRSATLSRSIRAEPPKLAQPPSQPIAERQHSSLAADARKNVNPSSSAAGESILQSRFIVDKPATRNALSPTGDHGDSPQTQQLGVSSSADSNASTWQPTNPDIGVSQPLVQTPGATNTSVQFNPRTLLITDEQASAAASAAAKAALAAIGNTTGYGGQASLAEVANTTRTGIGRRVRHVPGFTEGHGSAAVTPGSDGRYMDDYFSGAGGQYTPMTRKLSGASATYRELDMLSKELKNVTRYRDPVAESLDRVRAIISMHGEDQIDGGKTKWFMGDNPDDVDAEIAEVRKLFAADHATVTEEDVSHAFEKMWTGQWKLVEERPLPTNNVRATPMQQKQQRIVADLPTRG